MHLDQYILWIVSGHVFKGFSFVSVQRVALAKHGNQMCCCSICLSASWLCKNERIIVIRSELKSRFDSLER